jgi:hypothetical protein
MALSVRAVERDVARQRAWIAQLRHHVACFQDGALVTRLHWAECALNADTKLLAWMKHRLTLYRALNAERLMEPPQVID